MGILNLFKKKDDLLTQLVKAAEDKSRYMRLHKETKKGKFLDKASGCQSKIDGIDKILSRNHNTYNVDKSNKSVSFQKQSTKTIASNNKTNISDNFKNHK